MSKLCCIRSLIRISTQSVVKSEEFVSSCEKFTLAKEINVNDIIMCGKAYAAGVSVCVSGDK